MRHVLAYFKYQADRWHLLAQVPPIINEERFNSSPEIQEMQARAVKVILTGKKCYALQQEGIQYSIRPIVILSG